VGCGGLLALLAGDGAAVQVVLATDSGGVAAGRDERQALAERRLVEARAAGAALGVAEVSPLASPPIPDGQLSRRLADAAAGLRSWLERLRPDLLLVPSPLERTADHRAGFAAAHRALTGLRQGDPLLAALAGTEVWAYEVNHPAFPDVLVDVSAQLSTVEAAMRCHASQQAEHPYLAAALGLRRFRCLSLPPSVRGAEAYRRLAIDDFRTRGLGALVEHLGGRPPAAAVDDGPLVSVVVRTRDRPELLAEALASLAGSVYRRLEVVLVNDGGAPPRLPAGFPLPVVRVELDGNRGRAAAGNAGIAAAHGSHLAFLDDDDLVEPEHLATLAGALGAAGVRVPYTDAAVAVYELAASADGGRWVERERRLPYSRDFDPDLLLLDNYIPFHTVLLPRELLAQVGALDESLPFFEDWDLLLRLSRRVAFHHLPRVTCEYRVFRGAGHHVFGEAPRERPDFLEVKARVLAKHAGALLPSVLARAVDTLRGEAVALGEESSRLRGDLREAAAAHRVDRRELARLQAEERRLAGDVARLDGAVRVLQGEAASARGELERATRARGAAEARLEDDRRRHLAHAEELETALARQGDELRATYGEIGRLGALVAAMERTRAWRLHRRVERLRGR
jgi:LmbE family N-acetylglucosaminyl deacetylase